MTNSTQMSTDQPSAVRTMTAIVHTGYGTAPEAVLRLETVNRPTIRDDEVLVRVHAASIDRAPGT